jgi:hypothetical protein
MLRVLSQIDIRIFPWIIQLEVQRRKDENHAAPVC